MGWTVLPRHFPYLCIATALLVAFCFTPTTGLESVPISHCISKDSSLARLADCTCYQGGRGHEDGRSCGQSRNIEFVDLVCSEVSAVDLLAGEVHPNITCLEITNSPELRELTYDQLKLFPNLEGLILLNTGLETITDNLSLAVPYIHDLHLLDGQLTRVPRLGGLNNLTRVSFARNKIEEIDRSRFIGAPINTLDLSGNRLTELTGDLFGGLCTIRTLSLGKNRGLRRIEDSVFGNTNIQSLNLSYTHISRMPYTRNFERWLSELDLRGTRSLHTFDSHRDGGILKGQSFAHLREVEFNYHAHCCQLKRSNYSYYNPGISKIGKRETSSYWDVIQQLYDRYFGRVPSPQHVLASEIKEKIRHKRNTIPDENAVDDSLTCLNYTDLNIVLFPSANESTVTETTEEPATTEFECNCGDQLCRDCVIFNCDADYMEECEMYQSFCDCQQRRRRSAIDSSGIGETNNVTGDLLPDGWSFHPNSTDLICTDNDIINITTRVYQPCPDESPLPIAPSHTASAVPDISPTPTTLQTGTIPGPSPLSTMVMAEISTSIATDSVVTPLPCSSSIVEVFCTLTVEPTPPPAMVSPTTATLLPDGWFYPNPDNMRFACVPISEIQNVTTDMMTTPPTPTTTTDTPGPELCPTEAFPLNGLGLVVLELATVCSPGEDPFNPCEDLLGEDDVLRSFIWIVIILAFFGNFLVIFIFLGYTVIIKRTKVELFVVHFFYFNLALADFIMGIYLFTIAVQDLRTLGNFSMFDVAWRTQGGCDFAGFCAITSTMVSVYVLLVITVERLYTFSRALQKSHTSKKIAGILMAVGWGFGILMGILPVITNDVNDYTKTAICLPFDVSSKLALSYVLFLLLFTGVVFMVIAICYIIIFYQVFYRQKATISSVNDKKRWKTELKVALRMGTLVLTNFICWFPIALLGISAAVGNSLVDNITFAKWVMVFIFPINACLNPILYSVLSKVFRDNIVLTLGKCGLCGAQVSNIRRHRAGFTPSVTSNSTSQFSSEADRRGTIIERFRQFSISSTTNLLGRRNSTMSQVSSEEHYQINLKRAQRRRSSEYSSASSEDILGVKVNSRRGSEFSGGSVEEMTTFSNPAFRSSSPVGGSIVADGNHKGSPHPRISLGAVPEENELPFISEQSGEGKHNPAYLENEIHGVGVAIANDEQHACGNEITTNSSQTVNHHKLEADSTIDASTSAEHDSGTHSISSTDSQSVDNIGDYFPRRTVFNDYLHGSQEVISIEFD